MTVKLGFLERLYLKIFSSNSMNVNSNPREKLTGEELIVNEFWERFQIQFSNPALLITALKHRSFLNVSEEPRTQSNERLEFLGDAVLDLVVTQALYEQFPKKTEGELSKVKSILVSKSVLANSAQKMLLGNLILINRGEEKTGGRQRQSILADAFEAIIGAIYLDMGLPSAVDFIQKFLLTDFKKIVHKSLYRNHKSILLEHTQSSGLSMPVYNVIEEIGPDHAKEFVVQVFINETKHGEGRGKTKKIAEQEAAKAAIKYLDIKEPKNEI
jgi:ribonuclease-3